jgi:phage-related protein
LLSLSGFIKKSQKTRQAELELAERRLKDWRARGKVSGE